MHLESIAENGVCSPGTGWCVTFCVENSMDFSATLLNLAVDVDNIVDEVFYITSHIVWDKMFCGSLGDF